MAVYVQSEVVLDDLAGIIAWSDTRQGWVAAINPDFPPARQQQALAGLCARVGEECDMGALALAS